MLSEQILPLLQDGCAEAFVQERSRVRAMELSLGSLCALGRRTLSHSICAIGRQHQDWSADYNEAIKTHNLSHQGLEVIKGLRVALDNLGEEGRKMLLAVVGSLCNRTIIGERLDRAEVVGRCRKDARLCFPVPEIGRRKYSEKKFSPEAVRQDDTITWQKSRIHFGGAWRDIRYKEVNNVLW